MSKYSNAVRVAAGIASAVRTANRLSGSRTETQLMNKRNRDPISTEVGEYSRSRRRSGRYKRRTLRRAYQLINVGNQKVQLRYQGVNRWNSTTPLGGYFPLYNHARTDNAQSTWPIYLFDLTSFVNGQGTSIDLAIPMYGLTSFGTGPALLDYTWNETFGTLPDGSTPTQRWAFENVPGAVTSGVNVPFRRGIRRWLDIRMMMYGSAARPTIFDVSLISFSSPEWDPLYNQYLTGVGAGTDKQTMVAFHQWLLAQYVYNPIMVQNNAFKSRIKFHKNFRAIIQPQENTETANALGHMRQLNWFIKEDAICKYDWEDTAVAPNIQSATVGDGYQQNSSQCRFNVQWNKRKYLLIRASSQLTSSAAAPTVDQNTPTFDLIVRANHQVPI